MSLPRIVIVVVALCVSSVQAQVAITPTTGPWYTSFTETCGVGRTLEEAAGQVAMQLNASRTDLTRSWEARECTDYSLHIGILRTHDDEPFFTVPPCAPEKNGIEGAGGPALPPRCTLLEHSSVPGQLDFFAYLNPERHLECPPGYIHDLDPRSPRHICVVRIDDVCPIADPASPASGNVVEEELDYSSGGANPLVFRRYYNGGRYYVPGYVEVGRRPGGFPNLWSHTYGGRVYAESLDLVVATIVVRPEGALWLFDGAGREIHNHRGTGGAARIEVRGDGTWRLTLSNADVETYDSMGRLTSIVTRSGFVTTISYGAGQILVKDGFGRTLTLMQDSTGRIESLTDPAGRVTTYGYSGLQTAGTESLDFVTYPDGRQRRYTYAIAAGWQRLASIVDENDRTFASFVYDARGRLSTSEHAGGADRHSFTYTTSYELSQRPVTTVTDPLGHVRTYTMTSTGGVYRLASIAGGPCEQCGNVAAKSYDADGNVIATTDFKGVQTRYAYDLTRNLETSRTEAFGTANARTTSTTWHPVYRLPLSVVEPNRTTSHTYDSAGNLLTRTVTDTSATPNVSRTWTYAYNAIGQLLTEDGPRTDVSDTTTYTYYDCNTGGACGQLRTVTNALGQTTSFDSYDAHGQPLTITDPNFVVTTLTYDDRQRLTSETVAGELTTFSYWPTGSLKRVTLPDGSYVEYSYDDAHRVTQVADGAGNRVVYALDAMGNRISEHTYDAGGALSRARTQVFNSLNQLWKQIGAAGTPAVTTAFTYDANGNLTGISAPLGRSSTRQFDELARLTQVNDASAGVTGFYYDANGNLASVTDPRNLVTSYVHNGFDELTSLTSPDTGATTHTYDAAGNLQSRTDARGVTATWRYDALGRATSMNAGDQSVALTYDAGTNGVGRLTAAADSAHSLAWSYDTHGRVTTKTQRIGAIERAVRYAYTNGRLTSLVTPSGQTITYGYLHGRLDSIAVNGTSLLHTVLYEPFGPVRQWTWGNATLAVRTYDEDLNLTQVDSGGDLFTFNYDDAFRLSGVDSASDPAQSWRYGYDNLDRLTGASAPNRVLSWSYDANGNRQSTADAVLTIAADSNRLVSMSGSRSNSYTYSNAGSLAAETNAGRPTSLANTTTLSYTYNVLSQRIAKTVGSAVTHFVYDEAGHLLGEYTGSGALIQETVWMEDTPVATLRPRAGGGVDVFYLHTDKLNAPRKVTRPGDNFIVWRWDSAPFGDNLPTESPLRYHLRFPGQYYDEETGLSYNYFRDYDPYTGRYLQSDPIGLLGGVNTYGYAGGNPISRVDPFGLDAIYVNYDYYPVNTGMGFHAPLGHAGVVSVDPATGRTRYYEFGRYMDKKCGNVRRRPVPDLDIGPNGLPTQKSLAALYTYLSKHYGKDSVVSATYYEDSDYQATIDYAARFSRDHACYSLFGNNCKTFARDAATACEEKKACEW